MNRKRHRLAVVLGALSLAVLLLTALSLAVNHIEFSLSLSGDPPSAGEKSVESTHFQIGFRQARVYASRAQWLRYSGYAIPGFVATPPTPRDWLFRFSHNTSPWAPITRVEFNGWVFAGLLGAYPLIFVTRRWFASRRARNALACRACGYNLTGNVSGICPECGSATAVALTGKTPSDAVPITPPQV